MILSCWMRSIVPADAFPATATSSVISNKTAKVLSRPALFLKVMILVLCCSERYGFLRANPFANLHSGRHALSSAGHLRRANRNRRYLPVAAVGRGEGAMLAGERLLWRSRRNEGNL